MKFKLLRNLLILPVCAISLVFGYFISGRTVENYFYPTDETLDTLDNYIQVIGPAPLYYKETLTGNFLAGKFAQNQKDWANASSYMGKVIKKDSNNNGLQRQAMVLAMGSGEVQRAITLARHFDQKKPENILASLFVILDHFSRQEYQEVITILENIPPNSIGSFMTPILKAWAQTPKGHLDIGSLPTNSLYGYHALLIGKYLGDLEAIYSFVEESLKDKNIDLADLDKTADFFIHIEQYEKAKKIYDLIEKSGYRHNALDKKIKALKEGEDLEDLIHVPSIESPEDGAALVFLHMTEILYRDFRDDSALIFANMALYLNPSLSRARIYVANILARHQRYQGAIEEYLKISEQDILYNDAQRQAAELYEEIDQPQKSIEILQSLYDMTGEVEALIQIGHVYRDLEHFEKAVEFYNEAEQAAKKKENKEILDQDYWHLFYARGMAYERLKNYQDSEDDLMLALSFQPNHPYLLNYLGYSWADQGIKLDKSLEMIKKAVALEPNDGYISDSLGWVYYRMKLFKKSVLPLEKAVALLPYDAVINDHLGDAYWRTGRRLEAKFQWRRAYNHAKDTSLKIIIDHKINNGLDVPVPEDHEEVAIEKIYEGH